MRFTKGWAIFLLLAVFAAFILYGLAYSEVRNETGNIRVKKGIVQEISPRSLIIRDDYDGKIYAFVIGWKTHYYMYGYKPYKGQKVIVQYFIERQERIAFTVTIVR